MMRSPANLVPWQIWTVAAVLGVDALGDLILAFENPFAATGFAWKSLVAFGLLRAWRPVFVLFLPLASAFVLLYASSAPVYALTNLAMLLLVGSSMRFFSGPKESDSAVAAHA